MISFIDSWQRQAWVCRSSNYSTLFLHFLTHFCGWSILGCSRSSRWSSESGPRCRATRWLSLWGRSPWRLHNCHGSASLCPASVCSSGAPAGCKARLHSPEHSRRLSLQVRADRDQKRAAMNPDHHAKKNPGLQQQLAGQEDIQFTFLQWCSRTLSKVTKLQESGRHETLGGVSLLSHALKSIK